MSDRIPRLSTEEMPVELASFLAPRVKRLGYLGEFFQCTAHQPAALLSFLEFTEHLKRALPHNLTEVVVLSVAVLMDNDYERVQHERLCIKLGFSDAWLGAVLNLNDEKILTSQERLVQRLAIAIVERGGRNTTPELEAAIASIGTPEAIAVLMLVGRYISHALIVNTLNLAPPRKAVLVR